MTQHLLSITDLDRQQMAQVLGLCEERVHPPVLDGQGVALLFEHPSARTRNAAELAVVDLGGHPVTIRADEVGMDTRESAEDVARTLACFHSIVGARVARHKTLERMAAALEAGRSPVPLLNLLSDVEHPTQAIADLLTLREHFGGLEGRTVAYIGDGNNVCRSLLFASALAGLFVHLSSPEGYRLSSDDLQRAEALGGGVREFDDPRQAVSTADAVYTDVWVSMGQEAEAEQRRRELAPYRVDEKLMSAAPDHAIVLHCLPAHRGEEISAGVCDGPSSLVWSQAANRKAAITGILCFLFGSIEAGQQ